MHLHFLGVKRPIGSPNYDSFGSNIRGKPVSCDLAVRTARRYLGKLEVSREWECSILELDNSALSIFYGQQIPTGVFPLFRSSDGKIKVKSYVNFMLLSDIL